MLIGGDIVSPFGRIMYFLPSRQPLRSIGANPNTSFSSLPVGSNSIEILFSLSSMLYLQNFLLIHLQKCEFYMTYELKLPLLVSFQSDNLNTGRNCLRSITKSIQYFDDITC